MFHTGNVVILDSGFCVLKAIALLKKRGVYASALIKKRRYWPKGVPGDAINQHFKELEVGTADSLKCEVEEENLDIFCFKEPDYVMKLMSSYGTNSTEQTRTSKRDWTEDGEKKTVEVKYPEVVDNHFKYRHHIDDHNAKRHSPISLEQVWATKRWENRVFAFLLAVTEVNTKLAMEYFYSQEKSSQIDFRKQLAFSLIYNNEIQQEVSPSKRRRKSAGCGEHVLMSLPCGMKFSGSKLVTAQTEYPQRRCATCKKVKCRTYCLCNPGEHLCKECYAVHQIVMADK